MKKMTVHGAILLLLKSRTLTPAHGIDKDSFDLHMCYCYWEPAAELVRPTKVAEVYQAKKKVRDTNFVWEK
ncbi:hypothetical protein ACFX15_001375 [Malus domestica]